MHIFYNTANFKISKIDILITIMVMYMNVLIRFSLAGSDIDKNN